MIPLLPAWLISVGAALYAYALWQRKQREKALIVTGKIITLLIIAVIYVLFSIQFFDNIFIDRALSRLSWASYLITELCYHYAKRRWKL